MERGPNINTNRSWGAVESNAHRWLWGFQDFSWGSGGADVVEIEKELEWEVKSIARVWGGRVIRNYFLMGIDFQCCKMKHLLEMDSGYSFTAIWMYLIPMNSTFKGGKGNKFYVMYILAQLKRWKTINSK